MKIKYEWSSDACGFFAEETSWWLTWLTEEKQAQQLQQCLQDAYNKGHEDGRLKMLRAVEMGLQRAWKETE